MAIPKLRTIYLYIASLIGLVLIIIGSVQLINLGLKTFIFTKADQEFFFVEKPPLRVIEGEGTVTPIPEEQEDQKDKERRQKENTTSRRQRDAARSISLLIVGIPLYLYHWKLAQKERTS